LRPILWNSPARLPTMVDLPTPPFRPATAMMAINVYYTGIRLSPSTISLISYKMSLEGWRVSHRRMSLEEVGTGMLGVDRQHARTREVEPGTDPGIFGGEREGRVRRAESRGGLRLGKPDVAAATLRGVEAEWAGSDEALPGEDERAGAGADHTHGDVVPE